MSLVEPVDLVSRKLNWNDLSSDSYVAFELPDALESKINNDRNSGDYSEKSENSSRLKSDSPSSLSSAAESADTTLPSIDNGELDFEKSGKSVIDTHIFSEKSDTLTSKLSEEAQRRKEKNRKRQERRARQKVKKQQEEVAADSKNESEQANETPESKDQNDSEKKKKKNKKIKQTSSPTSGSETHTDAINDKIAENVEKLEETKEIKQEDMEATRIVSSPPNSERASINASPFKTSSPDPLPFEIKLRSVKNSNMNVRYPESLPEVQPIKTIIGVSHQQILKKMNMTDVKIKIIVSSSSISKYASTALSFTKNHTDELFDDPVKKAIFVKLCINVALNEARGFSSTIVQHPNLLQLFGSYSEINLETTRTKLTPPTKNVHQNHLDYSVLSYIGCILLWAIHLQRQANIEDLTKALDVDVQQKDVLERLGGYHLWDRLNKTSKMNSKRWKHVIKFRQSYPFEEDQFMLILRFMKVSDTIP
ncbi:hypothetical protein G9P44_001844 [Scheffersomyces stipitis]|nr:hypothetical protein G9P44_001844 [Scheffersomyces stipitis]